MNNVTHSLAILSSLFFAGFLSAQSPNPPVTPPTPPPMPKAEKHVVLESVTGGYQVILSRKAAEKLRDGLEAMGDGKSFTDVTKLIVKELNDPGAEAQLDLIAWAAKTQAPALKKSLDEKMGPGGAIIRVFGLEKKKITEKPLLKALGDAFLPPDIKDQVKVALMAANTSVLYWKVEGRK